MIRISDKIKNENLLTMKKSFLLLLILFLGTLYIAYGNYNSQPTDTIYKIEGKVLPVDVTKVTQKLVSFVFPGDSEVYTIERKQVQKIVYKNGRVEEFNKPVFTMIEDYTWEAVWLTENEKDVVDLYKRGEASAKSPPSSRSPKAAKKSAIIRLQKKAANMKGVVILVTHKQTTGGYGEMPGYFIKGIVYGLEPLEEEEETSTEEKPLSGGVVL